MKPSAIPPGGASITSLCEPSSEQEGAGWPARAEGKGENRQLLTVLSAQALKTSRQMKHDFLNDLWNHWGQINEAAVSTQKTGKSQGAPATGSTLPQGCEDEGRDGRQRYRETAATSGRGAATGSASDPAPVQRSSCDRSCRLSEKRRNTTASLTGPKKQEQNKP